MKFLKRILRSIFVAGVVLAAGLLAANPPQVAGTLFNVNIYKYSQNTPSGPLGGLGGLGSLGGGGLGLLGGLPGGGQGLLGGGSPLGGSLLGLIGQLASEHQWKCWDIRRVFAGRWLRRRLSDGQFRRSVRRLSHDRVFRSIWRLSHDRVFRSIWRLSAVELSRR